MKSYLRPPGGDITWLSVLYFIVSLLAIYLGLSGNDNVFFASGVILLPISIGLWLRMSWARWTAFSMCVVGIITRTLVLCLSSQPKRFSPLIISLTSAWVLWRWQVRKDDPADSSKKSDEDDDKKPMISLVLLLREPRYLDDKILAGLASNAWGIPVSSGKDGNDDATEFVAGDSPIFMAKHDGCFFMIHNHAKRYFGDDAAEHAKELRVKKALAEHTAWLSVDFMRAGKAASPEWAYTAIGKLLAELAGEDCLAIVCPAMQKINAYDPEMTEVLRSDDPVKGAFKMFSPPVLQVGADDPRVLAAVEQAHRDWPQFVRAFEQRKPGEKFAVKAPVSDGKHTEFMWLGVEAIENDVIYGKLDSDPVNVTGVKLGDRLHVKLAELNDWIFIENGEMRGGFTVKILAEINRKR